MHDVDTTRTTFIGHQRTLIWNHLTHEETQKIGLTKPPYSYKVVGFTLCDHSSTHVDAINHVVDDPEARSVDQLQTPYDPRAGERHRLVVLRHSRSMKKGTKIRSSCP